MRSSALPSHPALHAGVKNPFAHEVSAVLDAKGAGYNAGNDETPNSLMRDGVSILRMNEPDLDCL